MSQPIPKTVDASELADGVETLIIHHDVETYLGQRHIWGTYEAMSDRDFIGSVLIEVYTGDKTIHTYTDVVSLEKGSNERGFRFSVENETFSMVQKATIFILDDPAKAEFWDYELPPASYVGDYVETEEADDDEVEEESLDITLVSCVCIECSNTWEHRFKGDWSVKNIKPCPRDESHYIRARTKIKAEDTVKGEVTSVS